MQRSSIARSRNAGDARRRLGRTTLVLVVLLVGGGGVAGTCGDSGEPILAAREGLRPYETPGIVALPLGRLNPMGGNWSLRRVDFSIDTRLGTREVGATWNSASARWQWSFELVYDGARFVDESGARHDASVPDGDALPGTHWVRVDATRISTRGGLVHEFDPVDGRLVAVHWASAPWPRLRYVATSIAGAWRPTRVEQCTDAATCQPVYTIERDAAGAVVRLTDRAGRETELLRDAGGRLVAARDPKDTAQGWPGQRYEYASENLTALVNSEGERTELSFAQRRLVGLTQVGAGDPAWSITYRTQSFEGAPDLWTTEVRDPLGDLRSFRFDDRYRIHERENALRERSVWTWAGLRPASFRDPAGLLTQFTWIADDLASETSPSGNTRVFVRSPGSVDRDDPLRTPLLSLSDDLGPISTFVYDAAGRRISRSNGAGDTTTWGWGANEALVRTTQPSGRETLFGGHGEHGHPTTVTREGVSWSLSFDAVGNLVHGANADPTSGGVRAHSFDEDRNLSTLLLVDQPASGAPSEATLRIARRSDGQVVRIERPGGGDTSVSYDALGREVARVEWSSPGTTAAPVPLVTLRTRDALGRTTARTRPNAMHEERAFDAAGRVVRETVTRDGVVERDLTRTYADGRLVLVEDVAAGFAESTQYDAAGRPAVIVHRDGERSRIAYDPRGRATRRDLDDAAGIPIQAVAFGYDAADRLSTLGDGSTDLIQWSRVDGHVTNTSYANGLEERTTVVLGVVGARFWDHGTATVATAIYDHAPSERLIGESFSILGTSPAAGTEVQLYHVVDPGEPERRLSHTTDSNDLARTYAYDHLSNLTRTETPERGGVDWTYNAEGNRLLSGSAGGSTLGTWAWDEAGFAIRRGGLALHWTGDGRIARIEEIATGAERAHFEYDPLGRRSFRRVNGSSRSWSHGGLLELDQFGNAVAADLGVVRIAVNGAHVYRHADQRGNIVGRSDVAGVFRTRRTFDAYGPVETFGDVGDAEHGHARGLELAVDVSLGPVYVMGERVYDPLSGRFLSPDPVPQWVNDFAYTQGNPVEFWDPTGRSAEAIDWQWVGTWAIAIGSTVGTAGACGLAITAPNPASGAVCIGAVIVTAGSWAQVYALPAIEIAAPPGTLEIPAEIEVDLDLPDTTIWEPEDFPGFSWPREPGIHP